MAKKKSQNKLIKFIAASVGIILVGCSIAWYAGMQKVKEIDAKSIEYLEAHGFKVDRSEPSYSGFPFKIVRKRDYFNMTQERKGTVFTYTIESPEISAWIFNPTHLEFDGKVKISLSRNGQTPVEIDLNKATVDLTLDKEGQLIQKGWAINNINFTTNSVEGAAVKINEIASKSESESKGNNTEIESEFIVKNIELATKAKPIVIDKIKLKGKVTSKFKTYEAISKAIESLDTELRQKINESCESKSGRLPPIGDMMKELEDTKAKASGEIEIKIGKFKLEMDLNAKIKDGFPDLDVKILLDDFDQMTQSMVEAGTLDPSSEQIARLSLSAVADRDANEGDYVIKASLKDRKFVVGKNTIKEFKQVDWNNIPVPDDFCQKHQDRLSRSEGLMLQGLSPYISYPVF